MLSILSVQGHCPLSAWIPGKINYGPGYTHASSLLGWLLMLQHPFDLSLIDARLVSKVVSQVHCPSIFGARHNICGMNKICIHRTKLTLRISPMSLDAPMPVHCLVVFQAGGIQVSMVHACVEFESLIL